MTHRARPFDTGRPRPIVTALDMLRRQIDHEAFDAAIFSLDAVAADLGYGDVQALPGAVAWIDRLRADDKRIAVAAAAERAEVALEIAGLADRVDVLVTGSSATDRLRRASEDLRVEPERAVVVGVDPDELEAARAAGVDLVIGVARGGATPEQLRRAGAVTVVDDLQELLGPVG
jgi:beta-phosphoglucomutase-like phosphatase (HAD superfamily)